MNLLEKEGYSKPKSNMEEESYISALLIQISIEINMMVILG